MEIVYITETGNIKTLSMINNFDIVYSTIIPDEHLIIGVIENGVLKTDNGLQPLEQFLINTKQNIIPYLQEHQFLPAGRVVEFLNSSVDIEIKTSQKFKFYSDYEQTTPATLKPFNLFDVNGNFLRSYRTNSLGEFIFNFDEFNAGILQNFSFSYDLNYTPLQVQNTALFNKYHVSNLALETLNVFPDSSTGGGRDR